MRFVQLLNEITTCRSELKKTAQALVRVDPELFPSPENVNRSLVDLTASEIRAAATKKSTKSQPNWDWGHVSTTVSSRLDNFSFLNDPPTPTVCAPMRDIAAHLTVLQGEPLASPTLAVLCRSFYEEEKWQRALTIHLNNNSEWASSVTVTMVSLAATTVCIHSTQNRLPNMIY